MLLDGKIDDVKSASAWSYDNKFVDFYTLEKGDSFGYVPQLVGYAAAANKKVGGWWVVNKNNGSFKYIKGIKKYIWRHNPNEHSFCRRRRYGGTLCKIFYRSKTTAINNRKSFNAKRQNTC